MERTPSLLSLSSCGSSSGLISTNSDSLLPLKENVFRHQKIPPLKVLLGHLLYRRIVLWTLICLAVVGLIVSSGGHVSVSEMVEYDKGSSTDSSMEAKPEFTAYANGNFPNDDAANTYTALIVPASENPEGPQTSEIESEEDKIIRDEEEEEEDVEGEEEELDEDEADSKPWLRYPQ